MPPIKRVLSPKHEAAARKSVAADKAGPLWKGPEVDGITFSMLNRFLTCRERFRVQYVEGWRTQDEFNHRIEYGNMWHVCEEAMAEYAESMPDYRIWGGRLKRYVKDLCVKYPTQQEQIAHWMNVCKVQFPIYVRYWSKHRDMTNRSPLLQEHVFDVPYKLPSGRTVRLRGRWDSVDHVSLPKMEARKHYRQFPEDGSVEGIWIQENKTKSDIDVNALARQMTNDLQSMIYVVALEEWMNEHCQDDPGIAEQFSGKLLGVRYNVVRRPLSGGKGSITQGKGTKGAKCTKCKGTCYVSKTPVKQTCPKCRGVGRVNAKSAESNADFYKRLGDVIESAHGPEWEVRDDENFFFTRFNVGVTPADIERFKNRTLNPILEQVCEWYECMKFTGRDPFKSHYNNHDNHDNHGIHWQHPFGCTNTVDEYGQTDVDNYLRTGSTVGLVRREKLFEELV